VKLGLCLLLYCFSLTAFAASAPTELALVSEQPVAGMQGGNLSGLAWCAGALWTLSDRDDEQLYRLTSTQGVLQAQAASFVAPSVPVAALSWGQRMRNLFSGLVRGGSLDFEGVSCDNAGNRYLLSEAYAAVLQITPQGSASWLALPEHLLRQARASGMLWNYNGLFEGLAVDPQGQRLWLAAERQSRGLLQLHKQASNWDCSGACVLLSEDVEIAAPTVLGGELLSNDFADLAFFNDKLFTLERLAHQICRRNLQDGQVEHCWSFAAVVLTDARRYDEPYGMTEALWIDAEGAWLGVDNGGGAGQAGLARQDGETRPVVWRLAAPAGGWLGNL
jgi:hypothetical protein